jgi:WD40 repeat protein
MNIGELVQSFEKPLAGLTGTTALAFSPNSVYLAAGGHQMAVYVWDIERGNLVYELSYPDMAVLSVDFSDENNFIAAGSAGEKGGVYLWDLVDGSRIEFPIPVLAPDIEFMPNSPILAVATIQYEGETSPHGPILLWDVEEGTFESLLSGEMATSLAFSDDGELLAAAIDGQLRLWNIVEGEEIDVQNQRVSERVFRIDWSPEGHVAALNNDKTISIWGGDGKFVTHFADETIEDFVFIPGNKLVASVFDKPLQVYHILAP